MADDKTKYYVEDRPSNAQGIDKACTLPNRVFSFSTKSTALLHISEEVRTLRKRGSRVRGEHTNGYVYWEPGILKVREIRLFTIAEVVPEVPVKTTQTDKDRRERARRAGIAIAKLLKRELIQS